VGKTPILDRQPNQLGDVPITYADVSKAKQKLGYKPTTLLAEGVKKYVAWCRTTRLVK
jgi:UDP-glucuronate 4-epimerase